MSPPAAQNDPQNAPKNIAQGKDSCPSTVGLDDLASKLRASGQIETLLKLAHLEDLGPSGHDWTGELMFTKDQQTTAKVVMREQATVSGLAFIPDMVEVFVQSDESLVWKTACTDGQQVEAGTVIGSLTGSSIAIVRLERTLLNLCSRLSGIATRTAHAVALTDGTNAKVYDTRKTTPGLRGLEKYAVRCGGGYNHRMGLYDALLIKDNHLAGLEQSEFLDRVRLASSKARAQSLEFVQVEVDTLTQLEWLLDLDAGVVDIALLDNMSADQLAQAVTMRDAKSPALELEASGGVNEHTLAAIAQTGVDRISIGGLTHQATSVDIGLDIQ